MHRRSLSVGLQKLQQRMKKYSHRHTDAWPASEIELGICVCVRDVGA